MDYTYNVSSTKLIVTFPENNQEFGIPRNIIENDKIRRFLMKFVTKLVNQEIQPQVIVKTESVDDRKIINRFSVRIIDDSIEILIRNIYCGGIYGMDRIYFVLYNFEELLSKLCPGFNRHTSFSISQNYVMLENVFYSLKSRGGQSYVD